MCQYGFFPTANGVQVVNLTCAWVVHMDIAIEDARNGYPFGIEYAPGATWEPKPPDEQIHGKGVCNVVVIRAAARDAAWREI